MLYMYIINSWNEVAFSTSKYKIPIIHERPCWMPNTCKILNILTLLSYTYRKEYFMENILTSHCGH